MTTIAYVGSELDLFVRATNWKQYVRARIEKFLGPNVLEIGAGFGGTTQALATAAHERWLCVEPDGTLADRLRASIGDGILPAYCAVQEGTITDVPRGEEFDSILYMDVLEHIEDDAAEVERAAARLAPGGHLIVLSPAHPWLYTEFDRALGHFRRYTKRTLARLGTPALELTRLEYLDSVGLLASLANRVLLRQSMPTARQVAVWDKALVPASKWIDPLTCHCVGKSVLGVWRRRH